MPETICGMTVGNEGARASHEAHCDECQAIASESSEPRKPSGDADPEPAAAAQPEPQPAAVESNEPAVREESDGESSALASPEQVMQAGSIAAKIGEGLASNDPEEAAEAQGQALQAAGMGLAQLGGRYAQKKKEAAARSKGRAGEQLQKAESFAECVECSGQIKHLPPQGEEFDCPHCGTRLVS